MFFYFLIYKKKIILSYVIKYVLFNVLIFGVFVFIFLCVLIVNFSSGEYRLYFVIKIKILLLFNVIIIGFICCG